MSLDFGYSLITLRDSQQLSNVSMQGHIGLNEVAIGISVPLYWGRLMARVIGDKKAEHLCMNAALLRPLEALKVLILCSCTSLAASATDSNKKPQLCTCGVCRSA